MQSTDLLRSSVLLIERTCCSAVAGVDVQFADTSALLLMTSQIDITIQRSTLSKIDSWGTEAILVVKTPGSITADGLVIQDCNASEYLVSLNATADPFSGNVTVQNS